MPARRILGGCLVASLALAAGAAGLNAATVDELRQTLAGGERVVLIDIRPGSVFVKGHIPGAMNIPANAIAGKRLPRLGRVVVYGDGFHTPELIEAVAQLNAIPGINAEALDGGYAAWGGGGRQSTEAAGRYELNETHLSLAELKAIAAVDPNLVLVDLRPAGMPPDLSGLFPNSAVLEAPSASPDQPPGHGIPVQAFLRGGRPDHGKLFVLVDDGDGSAAAVALRLRAAGVRRLAILAGGQAGIEAGESPAVGTVVTQ